MRNNGRFGKLGSHRGDLRGICGVAGTVTTSTGDVVRMITQPVKLTRTPATLVAAAPPIGAHTDEILREAGYDDKAIAALRETGAIGSDETSG